MAQGGVNLWAEVGRQYSQGRHVLQRRLKGMVAHLCQVLKKGQEQVGLLPLTNLHQVHCLCSWYRHTMGTDDQPPACKM